MTNPFRTEAAKIMAEQLDRRALDQIARAAEMWAESLRDTRAASSAEKASRQPRWTSATMPASSRGLRSR